MLARYSFGRPTAVRRLRSVRRGYTLQFLSMGRRAFGQGFGSMIEKLEKSNRSRWAEPGHVSFRIDHTCTHASKRSIHRSINRSTDSSIHLEISFRRVPDPDPAQPRRQRARQAVKQPASQPASHGEPVHVHDGGGHQGGQDEQGGGTGQRGGLQKGEAGAKCQRPKGGRRAASHTDESMPPFPSITDCRSKRRSSCSCWARASRASRPSSSR